MKSKVFVSLLLALVMLFALAVPALAGKPIRGNLIDVFVDEHTMDKGQVSLQVTRDKNLKVTVVLTGGAYPKSYQVWVEVTGGYTDENLGVLYIARNGRGRLSGITSQVYAGSRSVRVHLKYSGENKYHTAYLQVPFG